MKSGKGKTRGWRGGKVMDGDAYPLRLQRKYRRKETLSPPKRDVPSGLFHFNTAYCFYYTAFHPLYGSS
jgi:hypothetical protein